MDRLVKAARFVMASPLLRHASTYTLSSLATKAIPFLLLPILTRFLTPADYGIVAMFLLVTTILEPFIGLALGGAVSVKYFDETVDLPVYLSTGVAVVLAAAVPFALGVFLLRGPISELTQVPPEWLSIVVVLVVARALAALPAALWLVQEKPLRYGVYQNLQGAALAGASVLLVVVLRRQWQGRVEAELFASGAMAAAAIVYLARARWLRSVFSAHYARHLLRFGVPLIPHSLGAVLMAQTDRLFVTHYVGVDETGLYSVGFLLASVIELAAAAFNNAYTPWLFKKLASADDAMKARLVRYTYVQFAGMAVFALVVALVMPLFIVHVLDERFAGSARYIRWFAVAFAMNGMYYMVTNYIFYAERTIWLALVTLTAALVNIPLNYVFITANGPVGAAQATACAMGLSFLLTWLVSARVYPMPWVRR